MSLLRLGLWSFKFLWLYINIHTFFTMSLKKHWLNSLNKNLQHPKILSVPQKVLCWGKGFFRLWKMKKEMVLNKWFMALLRRSLVPPCVHLYMYCCVSYFSKCNHTEQQSDRDRVCPVLSLELVWISSHAFWKECQGWRRLGEYEAKAPLERNLSAVMHSPAKLRHVGVSSPAPRSLCMQKDPAAGCRRPRGPPFTVSASNSDTWCTPLLA